MSDSDSYYALLGIIAEYVRVCGGDPSLRGSDFDRKVTAVRRMEAEVRRLVDEAVFERLSAYRDAPRAGHRDFTRELARDPARWRPLSLAELAILRAECFDEADEREYCREHVRRLLATVDARDARVETLQKDFHDAMEMVRQANAVNMSREDEKLIDGWLSCSAYEELAASDKVRFVKLSTGTVVMETCINEKDWLATAGESGNLDLTDEEFDEYCKVCDERQAGSATAKVEDP